MRFQSLPPKVRDALFLKYAVQHRPVFLNCLYVLDSGCALLVFFMSIWFYWTKLNLRPIPVPLFPSLKKIPDLGYAHSTQTVPDTQYMLNKSWIIKKHSFVVKPLLVDSLFLAVINSNMPRHGSFLIYSDLDLLKFMNLYVFTPNLGKFGPWFVQIVFIPFFPSSTSRMPVICMLEILILPSSIPEGLFFFPQSSFSPFFRLNHFYLSIFKVTHSSVPSTPLWSPPSEFFILDIYFLVLEFAFGSFL